MRKVFQSDFLIKLSGVALQRCSEYKYVGVYIDEKINWKRHILYVCDKISKACSYFSKLRHCAGIKTIKMVYTHLFFLI